MSNKYVCIHGHFYQPPRENPWLEEVEVQDSAYPYRDWNERINAECYAPNTASRIKSGDGKIIDIINNYTKMSFNFGPTLLSWMETNAPETYQSIVKADVESREKYSGHGSAIAQVYNHMIMPLANTRDKRTQVIWGIEDFRYRFGREPEGMWLAETAVDIESLETLAEFGIKFTILAPRQAKQIRKIGDQDWMDVSNASVDPKRAYLCNLPSGKTINLFFYDGPISQDLAFGDLLKKGENLAGRIVSTFREDDEPQIAHIATDGETYGHHQRHGDMALAYCFNFIESQNLAQITVYGEFLEKFPPTWEVEIIEDTSWSCVHGIERWRSNCGCNTGRGWSQEWRAPLREALDWLREQLIPVYEKGLTNYINDPWKLRDEYIKVILDRSPENLDKFFSGFANKDLSQEDKIKILKLSEMERHAMLMYTSCGWFFDEISGIETVQVILYAGRAIQLAKEVAGIELENEFVRLLEKAKSNIPEVGNGAYVYENYVKPSFIDLFRVAAHYAISTLFEEYVEKSRIFCYEVNNEMYEKSEAGKMKMVIGKADMRSRITYDEDEVSYAVVHLGDHNVNGGVRETLSAEAFNTMQQELKEAFERMNIADIVLLLDKHFGTHNYSLWHLFKDESRKVFNKILESTLNNIEYSFRQIYENNYAVMNAIVETRLPLPKAILTAVEFTINTDIRRILESPETIDVEKLHKLSQEAHKWSISIDEATLGYVGSKRINKLMEILADRPEDLELINEIEYSLRALVELHLDLNLWQAQNILFRLGNDYLIINNGKAKRGDKTAKRWLEHFHNLEQLMQIKVE